MPRIASIQIYTIKQNLNSPVIPDFYISFSGFLLHGEHASYPIYIYAHYKTEVK